MPEFRKFQPIMSGDIPYYMSAIGMSGARFVEGDTNAGKSGENGDKSSNDQNANGDGGDSKSNGDGAKDEDKFDGEGGPKALKAERDARAKAEKDLADARAALQKIEDDKLSDIDKANKAATEAMTRAEKLERDNWRLAALAEHPVSKDNRDLVVGTDEASFLASAKRVSELEAAAAAKAGSRPGYVGKSGTGGDGGRNPSGGSVEAGRDLYNERHKKTS